MLEMLEKGASGNPGRSNDFRNRDGRVKVRLDVADRPFNVAWKDLSLEPSKSL
jgi:hypothetical protein